MNRSFTRIFTNVGWLVGLSVVVVIGAFLSFASGVVFDDSYLVDVRLPEAGGVLPLQEVTVHGRAVGQVEDVELERDGVRVVMKIQGEYEVPAEADVWVLRRSPIGEQAVDLQPTSPDWTPAAEGATIATADIRIPEKVPFTLERAKALFDAVDPDAVATLVHELAEAFGGRGETLKRLNRTSVDLGETLVAGIPEFERLIASSEGVLATLRDHRDALAGGFTSAADLSDVLADNRPTMERLLGTGQRALTQLDALVRNDRANLSCIFDDLNDINAMLTGPTDFPREYDSKLDELDMGLLRAPVFFRAFDVGTQWEADTGYLWARLHLVTDHAETGQEYIPHRPTPATKPGAACQSPFGTGVNAVRQADHQPPAETSPGIDFAPLVEESDGGSIEPPDAPLPATGGGLVALAPLALGVAIAMRRRG